jgi:cobalt-zinc-cadmium resistance protein CzcA
MASSADVGSDALGVKVGFDIPLWFGRNRSRVKSAKIAVKVTEEEMAQTWNEVEGNLTAIIRESEEIQKTYRLFEETLLKESEQMLSSAMSAYETGKIGFLDLLDSQRMVVNIRLDFEETRAKRETAKAKLLKVVGLIRFEEE